MKIRDTSHIKWTDYFEYDESSKSGLRYVSGFRKGREAGQSSLMYKDLAYWNVAVNNSRYKAHRIVWEILKGPIPEGYIVDHLDGNGENNRIENLETKIIRHNAQNKRMQQDNTSGVTGVYRDAKIRSNGRMVPYWKASWVDENLIQKTKCFNIEKFGDEGAFNMACHYRESMIERLLTAGLNYTDRHGK